MKKLLALALAAVMALGLVACGAPASEAPASGSAEVSSEPKEVVINLGSEPPELNSIITTSTGSMTVLRHVVEGLTKLDPNDKPVPALAESWDVSEDGSVYTFHLKKDLKWSNGADIKADDFIFAWNELFNANSAAPYASAWAGLIVGASDMLNAADDAAYEAAKANVGYKAIDDYTIEVQLAVPCTYLLDVMAFPSFFPVDAEGYAELGGLDAYATEADKVLTNGAYSIESWLHEDEIVFVKNPNYYDAANIKIDKITMKMISDSATALNGYQAGELDMIGLKGDQVPVLEGQGVEILHYDDGSCWYLEFNTNQKGLNNAKIRKALTVAIDAESFVKNVVKNSSSVAYSFTPGAIKSGEFTAKAGKLIDREGYAANDYAKAKELLAEGLKEEGMSAADLKLVIVTDEGDVAASNCAFFQEQLKTHLGVDLQVEQMTYKARLERMDNKDFSMVLAGWGPDYNDPMTFMDLWISGNGNNHTSYSNPAYDKLIADAKVEADPAKYEALLLEAEALLMDEMPVGPIYNRKRDYVTSERLTGVVRTAFTDISLLYADVVA